MLRRILRKFAWIYPDIKKKAIGKFSDVFANKFTSYLKLEKNLKGKNVFTILDE